MNDTRNADHFDEVLAAYLEAVDAGWAPDRNVLLERYPSLRAELEEYFTAQDRVQSAARSLDSSTRTEPTDRCVADVRLPRAFGDYAELEEIARGGMGVVFRARQKSLNRAVALKMILSGQFASADERRRFRNEAEAAALMDHPHIIPIYEVGDHDGRPYFSMKLVEGGCLTDHLPRLRQDVRAGVTLLLKVARAVHYAHQRGILHRDLKPANVLIDERGEPLVTDFGLAKRFEGEGGLTQSGAIVGTANYMAPEQAWGKTAGLTTAADVHALGAMLYELLTGRPPFASENVVETLLKVRDEMPVPPRSREPQVDADLETICLKCLQKEPGSRYGSAAAFADDLERWLRGDVIEARRAGLGKRLVKWVRRNPAVAGLLATVGTVLLAAAAIVTGLTVHANAQTLRADQEEARRKERAAAVVTEEQLRRQAEESLGKAEAAKGKADVAAALAEEQRKKAETAEEKNARYLMAAQLMRVDAIYQTNPGQAKEMLSDANAFPIPLRDAAWRFYERACSRWELATLEGHTAGVTSVAFSPDGLTLASAADGQTKATGRSDKTARLWDVRTGQMKAILKGHTADITSVVFSPDGLTLASSSHDMTVRLWDVKTGQTKATLQGHTHNIYLLAFSPDGQTLASGSWDQMVRLWDAKTGQTRATLERHTSAVTSVAFSPDGQTLASASWDKTVGLWDVKTGQHKATLQGHTDRVTSVAFSPDGQTLASGSWDKTVRLWDAKTGQPTATLQGHTHNIYLLAFSPDGQTLASGSKDTTVRLWDVKTGQTRAVFQEHAAGGHTFDAVAFSPDGLTLASGSTDKPVCVWDVKTGQMKAILKGHTSAVLSVAFSPDGQTLASGSMDNTVRLWDMKAGQPKPPLQGHIEFVAAVAFSPDGQTLASGSGDKTVRLWDVKTGQTKATLEGHAEAMWSLAFSPDGLIVASASRDKTVRLWDSKTGRHKSTLQGHTDHVSSLAFSPDGQTLASGSQDKTIRLWDVKIGQTKATLEGHTFGVFSVAYSPDGLTLASGSGDSSTRLWDVKTGQTKTTLGGWSSRVAFSPDGQTLAGGSLSNLTMRLWDVKTGQPNAVLEGHTAEITSVAFSPDGLTVATASYDKTVRLWDAKTGQHKATLTGHTDWVYSVAFSPDGRTLASSSKDKTVRLWDLGISDPVRDRTERLALEPINRLYWPRQQAAQAELDKHWFAAAFHLGQLLKDKPSDADLLRRRDEALKQIPPHMERVP